MAAFSYDSLKETYKDFLYPMVEIQVEGTSIADDRNQIPFSNVVVDLTSGFEANQATYDLYNCFDPFTSEFQFAKVKKYILIGSQVSIYMGYSSQLREVFRGVICKVDFFLEEEDVPHITVTAMDIKAVMMANHYHKQLSAKFYSGAVKEIFSQTVYENLKGIDGVVTDLNIFPTPDAPPADVPEIPDNDLVDTDKTIEMVGESDYEFVVRIAKKFNYEFFCVSGQVNFRPAKIITSVLIELNNYAKVHSLNVSYDITGLVGRVEVRGLDVGKGMPVSFMKMNTNKISKGAKAKMLTAGSQYVYVDPTISSVLDAKNRVDYLYEDIIYRFGTLDMEIYGLPEIIPGRFVTIDGFGDAISNDFYVVSVQHRFTQDGQFITRMVGKAAGMKGLLPV